jgi:hypothetical protein
MGVGKVPNVRGGYVAQRMTNIVGVDSVHGSVQFRQDAGNIMPMTIKL